MQVLEEHYGLRMVSAVQSISARMATERRAKATRSRSHGRSWSLSSASPAVRMPAARVFECVLRADRYEFIMELSQE